MRTFLDIREVHQWRLQGFFVRRVVFVWDGNGARVALDKVSAESRNTLRKNAKPSSSLQSAQVGIEFWHRDATGNTSIGQGNDCGHTAIDDNLPVVAMRSVRHSGVWNRGQV